jgi:hypothetical protein
MFANAGIRRARFSRSVGISTVDLAHTQFALTGFFHAGIANLLRFHPKNLATFLATLHGTKRKIVLQGTCKVAFLDRYAERM